MKPIVSTSRLTLVSTLAHAPSSTHPIPSPLSPHLTSQGLRPARRNLPPVPVRGSGPWFPPPPVPVTGSGTWFPPPLKGLAPGSLAPSALKGLEPGSKVVQKGSKGSGTWFTPALQGSLPLKGLAPGSLAPGSLAPGSLAPGSLPAPGSLHLVPSSEKTPQPVVNEFWLLQGHSMGSSGQKLKGRTRDSTRQFPAIAGLSNRIALGAQHQGGNPTQFSQSPGNIMPSHRPDLLQ